MGAAHGSVAASELRVGEDRAYSAFVGSTQVWPDPTTLLQEAVWWIDATDATAGDQTVANKGTGGSALDATAGSTGSADSNDPKFLAHTGTNYIYLPGADGNYLSVPDSAALDVVGDLDLRVKVALDDWTPAGVEQIVNKWDGLDGNGTKGYALLFVGSTLRLYWSTDGSAETFRAATAAPGIADGSVAWIRATLDVDNGAAGHDVKFFTSSNGTDWTQLGDTVTTAGVTSINAGTSALAIGAGGTGGTPLTAQVHRVIVKDGIDGTTVLDLDSSVITSGSATSFTAVTGQVCTINRATSGRKTVAVTAPTWLFGTDDYFETPSDALLNFGASDSFTVLAVARQWDVASQQAVLMKANSIGDLGYSLYSIVDLSVLRIYDDAVTSLATSGRTAGAAAVLTGVRHVTRDTVASYTGAAAGTPATDTTTSSLANALPLRVGSISGGGWHADAEIFAAAVWRRPLTSGEISLLSAYFGTRCP